MSETLKKSWQSLHDKLVQEIIDWCKEHKIEKVDLVSLQVDGLEPSVEAGSWQACTDSCLELYKYREGDKYGHFRDEEPFLISV